MPSFEPPSHEVLVSITKEKADFIEQQAKEMYDFVLESREILTREAHTTLQWLFAIVVGSSGYLVTLLAKQYDAQPLSLSALWWAIIPLTIAAVWGASEARALISGAMKAKSLYPRGNTAQKLTEAEFASNDEHVMRFLTAWTLAQRIAENREHNADVGRAINRARAAVVAIPVNALVILCLLLLFTWLHFPWWQSVCATAASLAVFRWALWAYYKSPVEAR